jgi:hypothetical protein
MAEGRELASHPFRDQPGSNRCRYACPVYLLSHHVSNGGTQRTCTPDLSAPTGFQPVPAPWLVYVPWRIAEDLHPKPFGLNCFRDSAGTLARFTIQRKVEDLNPRPFDPNRLAAGVSTSLIYFPAFVFVKYGFQASLTNPLVSVDRSANGAPGGFLNFIPASNGVRSAFLALQS